VKFKGEIHQFSVLDLIQYLYTHEETGVLELISTKGEKSEIFFDKGQCIRAKYEGMLKLSEILLGAGKINQAQIDVAVAHQRTNKQALGMTFRELRMVSKEDIHAALTKQIEDGVHELLKWNAGLFRFDNREPETFDDFRVLFHDLVVPEATNTAYMLVDAISKFDTENNAKKDVEADGDAEENRSENIGFSISLLKLMMTDARKIEHGSSLLTLLLNVISEYATRAVLFSLSDETFVGIGGFGKMPDGTSLNKAVRALRPHSMENASLRTLLETRESFSGPAPKEPWILAMYELIGAPKHAEIMLLPVGGVQHVNAFAYLDMGDQVEGIAQQDLLDLAAAQTGVLMENAYLRTQVKNLQRRSIR